MQYNKTINNKLLTEVFLLTKVLQLFIINRIEEKMLGTMAGCVSDNCKMFGCSPSVNLYDVISHNVLILAKRTRIWHGDEGAWVPSIKES